jgi:hypothetical protein
LVVLFCWHRPRQRSRFRGSDTGVRRYTDQSFSDANIRLRVFLRGVQINVFGFKRSPRPFNHTIVASRAFAVHADFDPRVSQYVDQSAAGKLTALIGVEYLRHLVFGNDLFRASMQKPASMLLANRQGKTSRLCQSMISTS